MCSYFSVSLHFILSKDFYSLLNMDAMLIIRTIIEEKKVLAIFSILELIVVSFLILFANKTKNIYHSKTIKLTDKLEIPTPIGDGQYGTSWWLQKKDYDKVFNYNIINTNRNYDKVSFESAGIITNFEKADNIEKINFIGDNLHTLIIRKFRFR